jgi:hypothetical protein
MRFRIRVRISIRHSAVLALLRDDFCNKIGQKRTWIH